MVKKSDLFIILVLLILPLLFFWPVIFGGRVLLPFDNLYTFEPWRSFASQFGITVPHNGLLSDLILENYVWKRFIVESLWARRIPLWNPYLFAGVPFLAAGQHSALYPLSVLFYILPVAKAYGYFTVLHFFLAGLFTYLYARVIGVSRWGAFISAIAYAFSGFMVTSVVHPMIVAAATWLPLLLTAVELVIRGEERGLKGPTSDPSVPSRRIIYLLLGSIVIALQFLAGHIELSYYVLMVTGFYSLCRLGGIWWGSRVSRLSGLSGLRVGRLALWLAAMVVLGAGLAAVQLIPLYELVSRSFRQTSASYAEVVGWAYPLRQVITFLVPDFFGNPTHHSYFDVISREVLPVTRDFAGHPIDTIFWGIKNYVEAGSYMGILPLLLALIALLTNGLAWMKTICSTAINRGIGETIRHLTNGLAWMKTICSIAINCGIGETIRHLTSLHAAWRRHSMGTQTGAQAYHLGQRSRYVWIFASLAIISLLFVFGTPLYAILYYLLPGYRQLHTPFRWVFPYTFSIAVLAGLGMDVSIKRGRRGIPSSPSLIGLCALWAGVLVLLALAISYVFSDYSIALADRFLERVAKAQEAFASGRMLYSYQFRNFLVFGLFLAAAGLVLSLSRRSIRLPKRLGNCLIWKPLAILVLVLDLFVFGMGFNPAADPRLIEFTPPVVEFLKGDTELYRIASFDRPGEKLFNPNVGMLYDIADIRGYDSIIPKQYVDFMGLIERQGELLYNRIAPFYRESSLYSRLLDLLNVKYVLTTQEIVDVNYTLVYDGEIKVYRNDDYLPRAFVVHQAKVIRDREELFRELQFFDPRGCVILEAGSWKLEAGGQRPATSQPAVIASYTPNEVIIKVGLSEPGWLVLADSYFPGWKAYIATGDGHEKETHIYKANYNFRAVYLPAGEHTVRFKYSPMSFKLGLYASFLAGVVVLMGFGYWAWQRFYREEEGETIKRIAKNSLTPMATSLLNKVIDTAFAMLMLRLLGPAGAGRYGFAVAIWLFFSTITDFGLGTLLTREVAKDRSQANRYLSNTAILRVGLSLASLVPIMAIIAIYAQLSDLTLDTALAIILLTLSLIPSNIASSLSYLFNAYERFEYPAAIAVVTKLLTVSMGVVVLLIGWEIVGLAATSLLANIITAAIFYYLVRATFFKPRLEFEPPFARDMVNESYPLMLNNLLSTLFFRSDVMLLKPMQGDAVVGWYTTAYKFIDAVNIIPSSFTLAIFPLLSRYAASAKEAMVRAYTLSLKALLIVGFPLTVGTVFLARELILILGGVEYLPHSAIALRILIWFLPFSFINSVTHYVLIALNQQRFITKSFVAAAAFNVLANAVLIPRFSYRASALVTILSEIVLLVPFHRCVRANLGSVPLGGLLWRPALASLLMGGLMWCLRDVSPLIVVPLAGLVYVGGLIVLGTFTEEERALLRRLLPFRRGKGLILPT